MSPASYQTAPPRDEAQRATPNAAGLKIRRRIAPAPPGQIQIASRYADNALMPLNSPEGTSPHRRAGNGTRTRDPNLGKVVLYQLSYSREADRIVALSAVRRNHRLLHLQPTILPDAWLTAWPTA